MRRVLKLVEADDPVLKAVAKPVAAAEDWRWLIECLYDTMHRHGGVGLAAPQVGYSVRIAVIDVGGYRLDLVNPEIVQVGEDDEVVVEGCLSLPGVVVPVSRARSIALSNGHLSNGYWYSPPESRVIQHEIDHLNGILITDHLGD